MVAHPFPLEDTAALVMLAMVAMAGLQWAITWSVASAGLLMDDDPILWWIPLAITMGTHALPHMAHLGWPQIFHNHAHDGHLVVWQATARVYGSWAMVLLFMAVFWFLVAGKCKYVVCACFIKSTQALMACNTLMNGKAGGPPQ